MELRLHTFDLPLRHTFTISRNSTDVQPTLIVELEQDGCHGYGEATSNSYYDVSIEGLRATLESLRGQLQAWRMGEPEALWRALDPQLQPHAFAQCALDQAAWDLWGKLQGAPLYRLWGLDPGRNPASNFTIGIAPIDEMVSKLREMPSWPIYKIKLGTSHDLEMLRALREQTDATFRVDANGAWTVAETLAKAPDLIALGVEFIEQPLPAEQWSEMERLHAECPLPLIADESCQRPEDVERCAGRFHGINIKLVKCGGLTPARRMIAAARDLGMKVMVGCMTESTVGISAIGQLLPLLDYVDMDGAALLARDIATGVRVVDGICHYPSENGTGVRLLS